MNFGVRDFLMVTLFAIVGIAIAKVAVTKVDIPGVSEIVDAV